jgi:hypothetical protein
VRLLQAHLVQRSNANRLLAEDECIWSRFTAIGAQAASSLRIVRGNSSFYLLRRRDDRSALSENENDCVAY